MEDISRKVQEVQTTITELEEKLEELPRKIQEAETAVTELKEKLKEMRILEETIELNPTCKRNVGVPSKLNQPKMTTPKMRLNRFFLEVKNAIYSLSSLKCVPEMNTYSPTCFVCLMLTVMPHIIYLLKKRL